MNSEEEKVLFESWSWEYDYIKRVWTAPDGSTVTTDVLVEYTNSPDRELELKMFIFQHGKEK